MKIFLTNVTSLIDEILQKHHYLSKICTVHCLLMESFLINETLLINEILQNHYDLSTLIVTISVITVIIQNINFIDIRCPSNNF